MDKRVERQNVEKLEKQKSQMAREKYEKLSSKKAKYAPEILKIEGVTGIGIRVLDEKIVVYVNEYSPDILKSIPLEVDDYLVEIIDMEHLPTSNEMEYVGDSLSDGGRSEVNPWYGGFGISSIYTSYSDPYSIGTLGSWWYSKTLNRYVMVTNNHVAAKSSGDTEITAFKRQLTNSLYMNVSDGGVAPPTSISFKQGAYLVRYNNGDYYPPSKITSISSADSKEGDLITINGEWLRRKGYSKVWIGGVDATSFVKYWDDSRVEVYIPLGVPKGTNIEVKLELEGMPLLHYSTGGVSKQVFELIDFIPFVDGMNADVAIVAPVVPDLVTDKIVAHDGDPFWFGKSYQPNRVFRITGVQDVFVENMPVAKVGYRTGLTYSIIMDPSFTSNVNYNNVGKTIVQDTVLIKDYYVDLLDESGEIHRVPHGKAYQMSGDSGSSVFVADPQDLLDYMKWSGVYGATLGITEDDLRRVEETTPIIPGNFIGNHVYGWTNRNTNNQYSGGCDKAINWIDKWDLVPIATMNDIKGLNEITSYSYMNVDLWTNHYVIAPIYSRSIGRCSISVLSNPEIELSVEIHSSVECKVDLIKLKTLEPINLEPDATTETYELYFIGTSFTYDGVCVVENPLVADTSFSVTADIESSVIEILQSADIETREALKLNETGNIASTSAVQLEISVITIAEKTWILNFDLQPDTSEDYNFTLQLPNAVVFDVDGKILSIMIPQTSMSQAISFVGNTEVLTETNGEFEFVSDRSFEVVGSVQVDVIPIVDVDCAATYTGVPQIIVLPRSNVELIFKRDVVGEIILEGKRILYVNLKGKNILYAKLNGKRTLNVNLKGVVGVTAVNQNFTMTGGDTKVLVIPVVDEVGQPVTLTGCTVKWVLKRKTYGSEVKINKTTGSGITISDNQISITLNPSDTSALSGEYFHECELTDYQGRVSTITKGYVTIEKSQV